MTDDTQEKPEAGTEAEVEQPEADTEVAQEDTGATADVEALAEELLSDVPEHLKPLIPAELTAAQKIRWYRQAKATGVFNPRPPVPRTDQRKPQTTPKTPDTSNLPAHMKIAAGYKK